MGQRIAGPSSRKPRIRGPLRCGHRLSIAKTRSPTRKRAISVPFTRTSARPRGSRSASRATDTQLPASGDIAPEPHHRLRVRRAEGAVLTQHVDPVAGPLEVRLHAGKIAPPVRVLAADDPAEPALERG